MSKAVYTWDSDNHFDKIKLVNDDYKLEGNETFTKPEDGLYEPISHTGVYPNDSWFGVTKEEWEAAQPKVEIKPSSEQLMLNMMGLQLAKANQDNVQLKGMVNLLGQQVAQLKAGGTK